MAMTVEQAYDEIIKRGWGFSRQIGGMVVVGPFDGYLVEAWGMDSDPVKAVEKALETEKGKSDHAKSPG